MVNPSKRSLEDVIDWQFVVSEQHNAARYGTYDNKYWKQFMPGLTVISTLHPPKTIPKQAYEHASKHIKE